MQIIEYVQIDALEIGEVLRSPAIQGLGIGNDDGDQHAAVAAAIDADLLHEFARQVEILQRGGAAESYLLDWGKESILCAR